MIAAFDIGSTRLRYAAGKADGTLKTEVYTEDTDAEGLSNQISEKVKELEKEIGNRIETVTVASTGLIDRENNIIERFDTKDGAYIEDIAPGDNLGNRRVFLENDANAGALGEYFFGIGESEDHMIRVTIGTGIGAGIMAGGSLLEGLDHNTGEVGHIMVDKEGYLSQEGIDGSWEAYCSGRGIPEFANSLYPSLDVSNAKEVFEKAKNGKEEARKNLEKMHDLNSKALGTLANIVGPESIVIGGNVAMENKELVENIRERIGDYCYIETPKIRETELEHAEIYGAVKLAERIVR
jgi:glucokinase